MPQGRVNAAADGGFPADSLEWERKMALSKEWAALKNGSDIRGVGSGGIEGQPITLTDEKVEKIAAAFAAWLSKKTGKKSEQLKIMIGKDSRISGPRMAAACGRGFLAAGAAVLDCGLCTTPAMFMTCVDSRTAADGSVMITASHLPFNRNGLKFFTKDGGLESADITELLTIAESLTLEIPKRNPVLLPYDYLSLYAADTVKRVRAASGEYKPLTGKKIAVDAGNGAGGFYATKVLKELGADTSGSVYLQPDGHFPNHIPNPEDAGAMDAIAKAVLSSDSDLGIIFDTDVDRAAVVSHDGKEINRNSLIALISAVLLSEKKGTIVTDSVTSTGLAEYIQKHGGKHHRFKRGYKNVINEAIRLNAEGEYTPLAIETSGHAALKENYFLDDGAYLVTRLVIEMIRLGKEGKRLTDLIADLKEAPVSKGLRFTIQTENFKEYGQKVLDDFAAYVKGALGVTPEAENYEGVRVNFSKDGGNGWLLIRLSLHDPVMPVDIETETQQDLRKITEFLVQFITKYDKLDISKLKELL